MNEIIYITPEFAVTSALKGSDFAATAELGFCSVISNRPDGEEPGQLTARAEAVHAWRAGLRFRHVPAPTSGKFADPVVDAMEEAIGELEGPILAHCDSGSRSALLWAAASARSRPVDCVLAALRRAGFDTAGLDAELRAQAGRKRRLGTVAAALDCGDSVEPSGRLAA